MLKKGLGERGVRKQGLCIGLLHPLEAQILGKHGFTFKCSVLFRYLPPAAQPRFSCTTSWVPITLGFWWKAFISTRCWSPRCILKSGYGPDTCWWVGVSDLNPRPLFLGTFWNVGAQQNLWSELETQREGAFWDREFLNDKSL